MVRSVRLRPEAERYADIGSRTPLRQHVNQGYCAVTAATMRCTIPSMARF